MKKIKGWKHEKEFDTRTLMSDITSLASDGNNDQKDPAENSSDSNDECRETRKAIDLKTLSDIENKATEEKVTQVYEPRPLTPDDDIYEDIIEQFASAPTKPKYWFEEFGDYWSCSCGHINKGDRCKSCGLERDLLRSLFILHKPAGTPGKLNKKLNKAAKEKIDKEQIISIFITFAGALLVIKPQFSLSIIPSISGLMSAASAGVAYTLLRYLKDKESPDTIVFYFSIISVLGTLPFVLADYVIPTSTQIMLLLATGLFASIGQFGITYAYKYSNATEVSIYTYSAIVFGILFGFIFFHEIPDMLSLLGGAIIIAVAYYTFKHNQKKN